MSSLPPQTRILVVDDDPSVLALLEQYMKRSGYAPITAATGTDALEKAVNEAPDLVLLDIMLPDISGHEVCARLRADRNIRQIPIVMMTAHGDREMVVKCLENGADDFIRKPIDLAELRARLRAQTRSLEFRHFYRDFFEAFPGPLYVLKTDGRIVTGNHAGAEMLGLAQDALAGRPLTENLIEEHRAVLLQALAVAPESRTPVIIPEICFLSATSGIRNCELQIQSVSRGADRLLVGATDRTHRRYLESELYKTRDFLESVVQSSVDGIIAVNRKGTMVVFNEGAEKITGYRAEDVVGRMHITELYAEEGGKDVMRKIRSTEYGGVGKLETSAYVIVGKGGVQIPVNLSASLLHDPSGQEIGSVGIFQDLRERIRIEQELFAAREKLIASEREQAMTELAGAASHELNQPLTTITGYVQMLAERRDLDPKVRDILDKVAAEAERMSGTIKQIGKSAKFQTKKYLNNTRIVDLGITSKPPAPAKGAKNAGDDDEEEGAEDE